MAKALTIQVEGLKELRRKFQVLPKAVTEQIDVALSIAGDDFVERAINDAPRDEGILIQGISKAKAGSLNYKVVSASPYSAYVEFGTRRRVQVPDDLKAYAEQFRGKGGGSGEGFFQHIFDWVKRKGIRYESAATFQSGKKKGQNKLLSIEQTAYIIYHFLLLNGVRPHPYFFKQRQPVMDALKASVQPAIQKALKG